MDFKKMTVADGEYIRPILSNENEFSCETTFVNLLVWQNVYSNLYCIDNGQLFIKSKTRDGDIFRLPVGGDLECGIQKIVRHLGGNYPAFWAQEGDVFNQFKENFGNEYIFEESRDAFDYIYSRQSLSELSGKKYHSKRNHISSFSKKHLWRYEAITAENLAAVRECAAKWYAENAGTADRYLLTEKQGVELFLSNFETLSAMQITGGAIFVENNAVAFTLASRINSRVFDIHIEKALSDFAEGYTVINREFARRLPENVQYINREDDMGLEGLRKAKLSYKPEMLLKKYYCIPKENAK